MKFSIVATSRLVATAALSLSFVTTIRHQSAHAAIMPNHGKSFFKIDWKDAIYSIDGVTQSISDVVIVPPSAGGDTNIYRSPRIAGETLLAGQDNLRINLLVSYHQILFEFFGGDYASILTIFSGGLNTSYNVLGQASAHGAYYFDAYFPGFITGISLDPFDPSLGNRYTIGTIFLSNSMAPLYGNRFTEFTPVLTPVAEPTSFALLGTFVIGFSVFGRRFFG